MPFASLGLAPSLCDAVTSKGYQAPTAIQTQAIPAILSGRDLLGGSQTGTGKTAAFTLPLLQRLAAGRDPARSRAPRALVLAPTRELAAQVGASVAAYGKGLPLTSAVIFGGVSINPQIDRLRRGTDILIATPGRLLDHAGQRTVDLSRVEILVLDEADRMLDMGFIHDIRKVLKLLPERRQNLLFSATYSPEIKALAEGILRNPELVEVTRRNTAAETVEQVIHPVAKSEKRALLSKLIKEGDWKQVLVFARTKHGANRLAEQLDKDGIPAAAIHGNKSQNARTRALDDFKANKVRVLVATDVASRGLDIKLLPHVVNYELPNVAEDYVHRIGRTGRAGEEGCACSLVSADERGLLRDIEKLLKKSIPVAPVEGFEMSEVDGLEDARNTSRGRNNRGRQGNGAPRNQPQNRESRDQAPRAQNGDRTGRPAGRGENSRFGNGRGRSRGPRRNSSAG